MSYKTKKQQIRCNDPKFAENLFILVFALHCSNSGRLRTWVEQGLQFPWILWVLRNSCQTKPVQHFLASFPTLRKTEVTQAPQRVQRYPPPPGSEMGVRALTQPKGRGCTSSIFAAHSHAFPLPLVPSAPVVRTIALVPPLPA